MAGLAVSNLLAARRGERVRRPLRLYAALEASVAVLGLGLVLGLPGVAEGLAPSRSPLREVPAVLNGVRGLVAFALMLLPATAMGTTLPLLTRALPRHDSRFGVALGRLYGVAASLNLVAAAIALRLDRRIATDPVGSGRMAEALAVAESISPASLPKHGVPWRSWLVDRLQRGAAGERSPLARP